MDPHERRVWAPWGLRRGRVPPDCQVTLTEVARTLQSATVSEVEPTDRCEALTVRKGSSLLDNYNKYNNNNQSVVVSMYSIF